MSDTKSNTSGLDLARYEGHTPAPWTAQELPDAGTVAILRGTERLAWVVNDLRPWPHCTPVQMANAALIADAPLLLAEVERLRAANERLRDVLAVLRLTAREYLSASVPECAETGDDLGRESWTPGFRAKFEALEQLAKED